ncbi:23S rRNA G2445 N2-methylase RlmL [Cyclonatronum proteinivorum]|uniref:23S rRNA G2445 N2-methylase RlmL n=1 Tax=Cyclonatronum proteinivorum TaxID=1457365 RepID=A0A345UH51_9BACT|nr:hypothetical protein [Cyclonatronum proteinivorum]AXI99802.1 23S rRNA G2445 N2-methylase RlmL [Cyclonatronum proteinivorum]
MIENGIFHAKTHHGLEALLQAELERAGAEYIFALPGAVRFQAADEQLYRFLLQTRLTTGLELCLSQPLDITQTDLPGLVASVDWTEVLPVHSTYRVQAFEDGVTGVGLQKLATELERGIGQVFQQKFEAEPKVVKEENEPEFVVNIQISSNGSCQIMLEAGGDVLQRRGRLVSPKHSVLSPAMAAGLIMLSDWDGESPMIDPFANDGVLVLEAARYAKKRTPLFEDDSLRMKKWRTFRHALWKKMREEVVDQLRDDVDWIMGFDSNPDNISRIQFSARAVRLNNNIRLRVSKPNMLNYPKMTGHIMTAPPVDVNLRLLGDFARKTKMSAGGYKMGLFSSIANLDTVVGMKPEKNRLLEYNGRPFSFMEFTIFNKSRAGRKPSARSKADETSTPGRKLK